MPRRSNKQSNVVPFSASDELDDLMSSESIKPNIAFLGLSAEPTTGATATSNASVVALAEETTSQPRLVHRLELNSSHLPEKPQQTTSTPVADMSASITSSSPAPDAVKTIHQDVDPSITTPVADVLSGSKEASSMVRAPGAVIRIAPSGETLAPDADNSAAQANRANLTTVQRSAGTDLAAPDAGDEIQEATPSLPKQDTKRAVARPAKIHKCSKAQDGHSHIEEVLYGVLRRAGRPEEGPSQNVITQAGSSFLCKETRIHKRNLGTVLRRLVFKQTIEVLDYERSTTRTARRYRVFSYGEILRKRREAGLEWVVRRRGVEFVNPANGEALFNDPGAVDGPDASPDAVTAPSTAITSGDSDAFTTGDSDADTPSAPAAVTASPLGKEARESIKGREQENKKTTSTVDLSLVSEALQRYWQTDEAAVRQLVRSCSAIRPNCTTDEILNFIEEKGYILSKNLRTFTNPMGFLLHSIPMCFEGPTFDRWRERQKLAQLHKLEEEKRKQEEHQASLKWMRDYASRTLENPKASQVDRQRAQLYLEELQLTEAQP